VTSILFLCTGNAARSVMAGVALRQLRPDLVVETAGTLSVDGMPISWRTRAALSDVGLPWPKHASRQAGRAELQAAELIIAAPEHAWVRREHPQLADRTVTLIRLTKELAPPTSCQRHASPCWRRHGRADRGEVSRRSRWGRGRGLHRLRQGGRRARRPPGRADLI
jgi:protein-tyrosine-phosphatase